jgi:hypothetical protein
MDYIISVVVSFFRLGTTVIVTMFKDKDTTTTVWMMAVIQYLREVFLR